MTRIWKLPLKTNYDVTFFKKIVDLVFKRLIGQVRRKLRATEDSDSLTII